MDADGADGAGGGSSSGEEADSEDREGTPKIELIDTPAKEEKYRQLKTLRAAPCGQVTTVPSDAMDDL